MTPDQLFLTEFYPHQTSLFRFARRLTYDEVTAKDLVQDTFINALRHADKFELGTSSRNWLFTVMKNRFINEYRRERKRRLVPGELTEETEPAIETTDTLELSDDMARALQSVSPVLRKTLLLFEVYGFSFDEIAALEGIPVNTAKTRAFKAREKLKEAYLRVNV